MLEKLKDVYNLYQSLEKIETNTTGAQNNDLSLFLPIDLPGSLWYLFMLPNVLFIIGVYGFIINRKNLLVMLYSLELLLLAASTNFLILSVSTHDPIGYLMFLVIITIAAAETAVGLGLLVLLFRLKKRVTLKNLNDLQG